MRSGICYIECTIRLRKHTAVHMEYMQSSIKVMQWSDEMKHGRSQSGESKP